MTIDEVLYEVEAGVATVTINRPERRNAMSFGVMHGLREAVARARADDAVRVVILTGAGDKAFCAGADLVGANSDEPNTDERGVQSSGADAHEGRGLLADLFRDMWKLGKPIIARVRGYALAGGFGLACACDLVVASDDSVFGTPEINVGLWAYMITVPLLRSMAPKTALDLMMTGRRVPAVEGERLGFVQRVVSAADLDATVEALARDLAQKSPLIMRWGRDSFYRVLEMDADAALSYLQSMLTITSQTEDAAEGVAAFAEKREPRWKGR
jgi:enoyl-CoA hydratase/carnithine racemase